MKETEQTKKEKQIRKRVTYNIFLKIAKAIETKPVEDVLDLVHSIMDKYGAYGSMTQSKYAKESLDLLKQELNHKAWKKTKNDFIKNVRNQYKERDVLRRS